MLKLQVDKIDNVANALLSIKIFGIIFGFRGRNILSYNSFKRIVIHILIYFKAFLYIFFHFTARNLQITLQTFS